MLVSSGVLVVASSTGCSDPVAHDTSGGAPSGTGGSGQGGWGGAGGAGGAVGGDSDGCSTSNGACKLTSCTVPIAGAQHTAPCTVLEYASNPPTSGTHYEVWAAYEIYDQPVPRGFLVHALEHSAVVLSYNCSLAEQAGLDCGSLIAELARFSDEWPADPLCSATRHRLVVTPDPLLDAPFAAAAWGYYLKGDCFDAEQVASFVEEHYGDTYENICNPGVDPGGYPRDCGQETE